MLRFETRLAKTLDQHDIAGDVVRLRVEQPLTADSLPAVRQADLVIALGGLVGVLRYVSTDSELPAFLSSSVFIVGMMTSAAFGVFPFVLPANANPDLGLTIYNSATSAYSMKVGLAWWIPGMILALGYFIFIYRKFAGKVRLEEGGH